MDTTVRNHLQFVSREALAPSGVEEHPWLWDGFLARGMITLLTSRWKSGKTTLVAQLLARTTSGGTLAGSPVSPASATVVTEEPLALWRERHSRLGFGPDVRWACRPFKGRPTADQWAGLIDDLAAEPAGLVVLDPLAMFLPGTIENNPGKLLGALEMLHRITDTGAAVLLLHHPKKAPANSEQSPRGTGALTGFADILIDLDRPLDGNFSDRVRRLTVSSHLRGTFRRVIELTPDGSDYLVLPEPADSEGFEAGWPILKITFEDSAYKLTRNEILSSWPSDYDRPAKTTLIRWLERALKEGLIKCHGIGRNHDPYKYCLKGFVPYYDELPAREPPHYEFLRLIERRKQKAAEG